MSSQDEASAATAVVIPPPVKVEVIHPPTNLRDKVSITADGVDLDVLEKAEQVIASLSTSYLEWVEEDLRKVQKLVEQIEAAAPEAVPPLLSDLYTVAHDIKGQGGSFNYHLMTAIGKYLCRFIEAIQTAPQASHWPVLRVHVDALRLIIAEKMEGDGGAEGDRMLRGLRAAITKTVGQIDLS
jgi:hypothetical protein